MFVWSDISCKKKEYEILAYDSMKKKGFEWRKLAKADWVLLSNANKEVWYLMEHVALEKTAPGERYDYGVTEAEVYQKC